MSELEKVLSLDIEESDYLYRIQRGRRVVYVSVKDTSIIPQEDCTDGFRVLSVLRNLPPWNEKWQTLTIHKSSGDSKYAFDAFSPHTVDLRDIICHKFDRHNFLDLNRQNRISTRLSRALINGNTYIVKIATFKHEVKAMRNEIEIYNILHDLQFELAPQVFGLVYEETMERTIGIIIEDISGRHPDINDLSICQSTVQRLHSIGICHGDLNRYNFIITNNTAKVIDFEVAYQNEGSSQKTYNDELEGLPKQLSDTSGIGRR